MRVEDDNDDFNLIEIHYIVNSSMNSCENSIILLRRAITENK